MENEGFGLRNALTTAMVKRTKKAAIGLHRAGSVEQEDEAQRPGSGRAASEIDRRAAGRGWGGWCA